MKRASVAQSKEIKEILSEINRTIELRRIAGDYPPGLEQQLEREFAEIISLTNRRYFSNVELESQIDELQNLFTLLSGQTSVRSRIPGATLLHRLSKFMTKRQILGLTEQIRRVEFQTLVVLRSLAQFAKTQEDTDARLVRELSQHVLDRISVVDHLSIVVTELESRLIAIENSFGA